MKTTPHIVPLSNRNYYNDLNELCRPLETCSLSDFQENLLKFTEKHKKLLPDIPHDLFKTVLESAAAKNNLAVFDDIWTQKMNRQGNLVGCLQVAARKNHTDIFFYIAKTPKRKI